MTDTFEEIHGLDPGIARVVKLLRGCGIETYESCEGGADHAFPVPTVRFHGDAFEGFRAFASAMRYGLPVAELRRVWVTIDEQPTGPHWEMTFASRLVGATDAALQAQRDTCHEQRAAAERRAEQAEQEIQRWATKGMW